MHMKMNKDHHPYAESMLALAEGDRTEIHTIIQHRIWIFPRRQPVWYHNTEYDGAHVFQDMLFAGKIKA